MARFVMPVLFVADIEVSKQFYKDVFGLSIEHDFGANVVFADAFSLWQRDSAFGIIHDSKPGPAPHGKEIELYFETGDLETRAAALRGIKEVTLVHDIVEQPWGQRAFRFQDPDGFIIEVAETMDSVVLRLLRAGMGGEEVHKKTMMPLDHIQDLAKQL